MATVGRYQTYIGSFDKDQMRDYMYILIDENGTIRGRFDHLMDGESLANKIENGRGHGKVEWTALRNYYESYGSNGVHWYRMIKDNLRYFIFDKFNDRPVANFATLESAVGFVNDKLVKNNPGVKIEFTQTQPGFWWGHNAPDLPSIIKDEPQAYNCSFRPRKYDYFEIKALYEHDGKEKV